MATEDAGLAKSCTACFGRSSAPQFVPSSAGGEGYTVCGQADGRQDRSAPQAVALRTTCGEGVGDLRSATGGLQRCRDCAGAGARLDVVFLPSAGQNRTICNAGRRLSLGETSAAPKGDAAALACSPDSLHRQGMATEDAGLAKSCTACFGRSSAPQFVPSSAGGEGYTVCGQADGRQDRSAPQAVALRTTCGEGVGDLRSATGGLQRCRDCAGASARLDVVFLPSAGQKRTICNAGRRLSLRGALATSVGEGFQVV